MRRKREEDAKRKRQMEEVGTKAPNRFSQSALLWVSGVGVFCYCSTSTCNAAHYAADM